MKKLIVLIICIICLVPEKSNARNNSSDDIKLITREESNYLTPENTLTSRHSALFNEDLDWADDTMTKESLEEQINDYEYAGIDRTRLFELEKNIKKMSIIDEITYKDSTILVVEAVGHDGTIQIVPFPFVKEDNLWKFTNKFSEDEIMLELLYFVPPLFNGKGQKPDDVNLFLGYEQPTQTQTELTAGTLNYTVHVYYGKTINPSTFTAELNKQDISGSFEPQPFTDQEIEIPLQQGRNVLVLSVEGKKKNGKKARDKDRLVFNVQ